MSSCAARRLLHFCPVGAQRADVDSGVSGPCHFLGATRPLRATLPSLDRAASRGRCALGRAATHARRCSARQPVAGTAVFGEEPEQIFHVLEVRGIENVTAFLARNDQAGMNEFLEMKRKRRRRRLEFGADLAHRLAGGSSFHQQAKNGQARFLRQSGECGDCFFRFHVSIIIELTANSSPDANYCQAA